LIERARSIEVATLVIDGGASPPWMRDGVRTLASALRAGHERTMEGQTHDVAITALAPVLDEFFAD
jgi:hypothetical protein